MSAIQWILIIMLGGLAGLLGQSARILVGLKKIDDQAVAEQKSRAELISVSRMVISIGLGFTAGAFAAVLSKASPANIALDQLLAFAAAGYAGADFIEGIMSRFVPGTDAPVGAGTGTNAESETETESATIAGAGVG